MRQHSNIRTLITTCLHIPPAGQALGNSEGTTFKTLAESPISQMLNPQPTPNAESLAHANCYLAKAAPLSVNPLPCVAAKKNPPGWWGI